MKCTLERGPGSLLVIQYSPGLHSSSTCQTTDSVRCVAVDDLQALRSILTDCSERFTILCGDWCDLSVDLSQLLADWALKVPDRGFSILPGVAAQDVLDPFVRKPSASMAAKYVSVRQENGTVSVPQQTQPLDPMSFQKLYEGSQPPIATSLVVHGAEHCISFLGTWLTTQPAFAPTPDTIHPMQLRGAALFIGSCGVLRLGDSVVPQASSLPAYLFRQFSIIIGAFRTISPSPNAERIFREGFFGGACAGTIVNRLNADHIALNGSIPAYTMLGDASLRLRNEHQTIFPMSLVDTESQPVPDDLTASLVWWDQFGSQCARAGLLSEVTKSVLSNYEESWRQLRRLCVQRWMLGPQDIASVTDLMIRRRDALRQSILADVAGRICQGSWIISGFASQSPLPTATQTSCARCGEVSIQSTLDLLGDQATTLVRDECNRCSTTCDRIGDVSHKSPINAKRVGDIIDIQTDPLKDGEIGFVMMHRDETNQLFDFPERNGSVQIPLDSIGMIGRRVVVALFAGPMGLQCQYDTIFIEPKDDALNKNTT